MFEIIKLNLLSNKKNTDQWKIPLYKVLTDKEDIKQVSNVLKRGTDWAIGPEIEKFETSFAEYIGRKYCVAFNSGTSGGVGAVSAQRAIDDINNINILYRIIKQSEF